MRKKLELDKILKSCRICLRTKLRRGKSLFENLKSATIFQHLNNLTRIVIRPDENLPDKICLACFKQLEIVVHFVEKCESSHAKLSTLCYVTELKLRNVKQDDASDEARLLADEDHHSNCEDVDETKEQLKSEIDKAIDVKKNKSKKIEDVHMPIQNSQVFDDKEFKKTSNKVELGLQPSRASQLRFECDDCCEIFRSKCKIRVHWVRVHLPQKLICTFCKKDLKEQKKCKIVSKADIQYVDGKKRFCCTDCQYQTQFVNSYMSHSRIHTKEQPYACELCGKTYTQIASVQRHKERAHKMFLKEMPCPYCGQYIKGRDKIYAHLKRHGSIEYIKCEVCTKTIRKSNHKLHMQMHTKERIYRCNMCDFAHYTLPGLHQHKKNNHEKQKYLLHCDKCQFTAYRKDSMKKHALRHDLSFISCKICNYLCESEKALTSHKNQFHLSNEDKPYKCQYCSSAFTNKDNLWKHLRKHHNKISDICDKIKKVKDFNTKGKEEQFEEEETHSPELVIDLECC